MPLLFRITLTFQLVYFKNRDVFESRYSQNISSRSSSRRLGQVGDQGMRDGKGVHTIRDSCYHREKGAENTYGGMAANMPKVR